MAADATVYLNNGAKVITKLDGVAQIDSWVALKLTDYSTNIKALFYLDGAFVIDNGAGSVGFIGYAWLDGANIAYHADARKSKTIIENSVGRKAVLLNDAGLNTKGSAGNVSVPVPLVGYISGTAVDIKVLADFLSAYYCDTTDYGIDYTYKTIGSIGGSWTNVSAGALEKKTASTAKQFFLSGFDRSQLRPEYNLYIKAYLTNSEGTTTSTTFNCAIMAAFDTYKSNYSGNEAACEFPGSGTMMTLYGERGELQVGDTLYTDALKVTTAGIGSYGVDPYSADPLFLVINNSGVITQYSRCPIYLDYFVEVFVADDSGGQINMYAKEDNNKSPKISIQIYGEIKIGKLDEFDVWQYTYHTYQMSTSGDEAETDLFDVGGGSSGSTIFVDESDTVEVVSANIDPSSYTDGLDLEKYRTYY